MFERHWVIAIFIDDFTRARVHSRLELALFTINDELTLAFLNRWRQYTRRVSPRFLAFFVRFRCFPCFPVDEQRSKFRQTDPMLAHADSHARVYFRFISYWDIFHAHNRSTTSERKLCSLTTLGFRTISRCFLFLREIALRCWERVMLLVKTITAVRNCYLLT